MISWDTYTSHIQNDSEQLLHIEEVCQSNPSQVHQKFFQSSRYTPAPVFLDTIASSTL
jgi:hypothetical protein